MTLLGNLKRTFIDLNLDSVPAHQLNQPVMWDLPSVLWQPTFFAGVNLWKMQHEAADLCRNPMDSLELLLVDMEKDLFNPDRYVAEREFGWLGLTHDGLSLEQKRLRTFLWLATKVSPPTYLPCQRIYPMVMAGKSLLLQVGGKTYGYHGGRWGIWNKKLGEVMKIKPERYAKSAAKLVSQAEAVKQESRGHWADAVFQYVSYLQPVSHEFVQALSYARLFIRDLALNQGQIRLTLNKE